MSAVFLDYIL